MADTAGMRTPRHNAPGVAYHLIWRFVDREWFFEDDQERGFYLRLLGRALIESDWRCFSYALMSNHIHLAAIAGATPMSTWTRRVNSPFAQWMNLRHERLWPVFADRARDFAITPEKIRNLLAYIHNNPVRAGVVRSATDSNWTSHRAYLGLTEPPPWLDSAAGMQLAGFDDQDELDAWVRESTKSIDDPDFAELRHKVRRRGAIELATPLRSEPYLVPLVARPFAHIRVDPVRLVVATAEITGLVVERLCSRSREPNVVSARLVAVYSGRAIGLASSDIAAALGVTSAAVTKISRRTVTPAQQRAINAVCARLEIEHFGREVKSVPGPRNDFAIFG